MNVRHDMVTVFVVRAGTSDRSYEFLQLLRAKDSYLSGVWAIVRGGVEPGESYLQAALRELREETGLQPVEFYRLASVESFYTEAGDTLWHSVAFCAVVDDAQAVQLNEEHDDFRWISRQNIDEHTLWASERTVLIDLCRDILDDGPAKPHLRIKL